ncbi:MAG TPA: hypothetical protein VJ869_07210 [Sphaerochaeta sp.]|nr:hypothetical protein [Sphaerochaeta sp.]
MYTEFNRLNDLEKRALNISMFKAYDIRTKSSALTPTLSHRLVTAVGKYFQEILKVSTVVVGRDARLAAPAMLELAVDIFAEMGLHVLVNPLQISTSQFYFSCMQNPHAAAVMFTASHNPGEYIGLKLMAPQMQTLAMGNGPLGGIACIRELYIEGRGQRAPFPRRGTVTIARYLDQFIDYSMKLAGVEKGSLSGVSILTDYLNGAAGTETAEALGLLGSRLRVRNLIPDGNFPVGDPNPIVQKSIQPTWDLMKKENFDFGFAYDGDGDRMDIMNSQGEQLAPSFNLSLLVPEITSYFKHVYDAGFFSGGTNRPWKPHMYYDVKANPLSVVDQARKGIGVHVIRNGHSFIKEALRQNMQNQFLVASEESAHYYMNFPYSLDDFSQGFAATENTLYFTLLTAKMWASDPKAYEDAFVLQDQIYRQREWPCHFFTERLMEPVMQEVEHAFASQGMNIFKQMEDGSDLDATLMRSGLPAVIDDSTCLNGDWLQVAQRISRSEEGMTRWEVSSSSQERCQQAVAIIRGITDKYVLSGDAQYL